MLASRWWGAASLHANELAGVLTLYLPLTVALSVGPVSVKAVSVKATSEREGSRLCRLQLVLLTLLFGLVLAETGSRGGILATTLAVAGVLAASGRRGRWILAAGVLVAVVVLGVLGPGRVFEALIYQGSVQGFSVELLLSGRLAIWRQGLHALADFPVTGIGLGRFGEVAPVLYPGFGPAHVEDAHQIFLQAALDVGIPGLMVMIVVLLFLVRRLLSTFQASPRWGFGRVGLIGWFGSLGAHLIYGLTDSVSLGTPGNVAFWLFCGLGVTLTRGDWPRSLNVVALGLIVLLVSLVGLGSKVQHNRAALTALRALEQDPVDPGVEADAGTLAVAQLEAAGACRGQWLIGLLADRQGQAELRDGAWSRLIRCSPSFFEFLEVAGGSQKLAELAVDVWPDRADAHFWLARASEHPSSAIDQYRRGLELAPGNGRGWIELAHLLAPEDPRQALEAYIQACLHGDPGANGCVGAGRTAERLGDTETANRWYGASRWLALRQSY